MLVLLKTAGNGERRIIGRYDSVSLSAGIQAGALIGKGPKTLSGSAGWKNEPRSCEKEPDNGSVVTESALSGANRKAWTSERPNEFGEDLRDELKG